MKSKQNLDWTKEQLAQMNALKEQLETCRELCKACGVTMLDMTFCMRGGIKVYLKNQPFFDLFDQYETKEKENAIFYEAAWEGIAFTSITLKEKAPDELALEQGA